MVSVLVKDLRSRRIHLPDNPDDVAFADRPRCDGLTDPSPTLLGDLGDRSVRKTTNQRWVGARLCLSSASLGMNLAVLEILCKRIFR